MRALVLGHGYSAGFLTPLLRAEGWQVQGTTRGTPERVAAAGAEPLLWSDAEAIRRAIAHADAILVSAGPEDGRDPTLATYGAALTAARPAWLGYLSTTGVYGDHQGGWVDEETALTPSTRRGRERVAAEAEWQALASAHGLPLHIFRLAGIYGPGRGPFAKVRAGTARRIVKPGQVFSRIHAEDIARALLASIHAPRAGAIYNLCDDDPAPPEDVIAHAAELLGLPLPPAENYATAEMTPMARSFYAESKRVSNRRMKQELGVVLRYPDYRRGLAAMLAQAD
ncbi:NAD-dependent epimerase/dehydratase family protein [Paracoccus limosus]|jgi:nucleoside-diphosphate-sugar epimerase|uniref:NAD-dependent epimerase/dehydratase family protein n=1 Tax=Paracoccus limosus TaxID=913252 RepID=A0A844H5J3_9RHOB|nr:SDR family oxidoreductase [Paracoccus limosus]MTH34710.1 NAD-dependent epimerase/dehydratase family protein [Paracoccus limosus]